jgi:hypothetical protein
MKDSYDKGPDRQGQDKDELNDRCCPLWLLFAKEKLGQGQRGERL